MSRDPSEAYVSPYLTRPLRSLAEALAERGAPAAFAPPAVTTFGHAGMQSTLPRLPAHGPLFQVPARAALETRRTELAARRAWLINTGNVTAARALTQELVAVETVLATTPLPEHTELAVAC